MSSNDRKRKAHKGSVQIKSSNSRLQLVFTYAGKRRYLSLGLPDTANNRRAAQVKANTIEADIFYERFDTTLAKYKPQSSQDEESALTPIVTPRDSLIELWDSYTQYKSPQISPSTLARDYKKIAKRLQAIPSKIEGAVGVRDWLLKQYSSETARRTLVQLNACLNWALRSGLSEDNPFEGMASDIKKTVRNTSREPFSREEVDRIIAAFENNSFASKSAAVPHSYYASFVKFMFLTGCRPEEAIALQWKHITTNCDKIHFDVVHVKT